MKIVIVGSGYVGLVTGTCFAETGHTVYCVDVDKSKIDKLNNGVVPIYEPGLESLIERNVEKERLFFTTDLKAAMENCEVIFSAVGTPPDEDGSADLKYVLQVAREVGQHMQNYLVMVTKSTVPIGTSRKVKAAIQEELDKRGVMYEFDVASNPEFLKEGDAIDDFMKPDRIVVGVESERAEKTIRSLYNPFLLNGHPILFMDIPSAELTKYAANSMLATRISFMNEIANLCELVGADVNMVRKGIGSDGRIGSKFLYSGVGYGGSCFPKDVKALIKTAQDNNFELSILQAVEDVNANQKKIIVSKLLNYFNSNLAGKRIAMWGLSFKPNTDDMREAPALVIIDLLLNAGAQVIAYDPVAMEESHRKIGDAIKYAESQYDAVLDADALLVITEWNEFRSLNYPMLKKLMKNYAIFDGRNIYEPSEVRDNGFDYFGIGRRLLSE